ncbi:hypothetical protein VCCP10303_3609, partial [Vibrio cholerae CP1030(3)]
MVKHVGHGGISGR